MAGNSKTSISGEHSNKDGIGRYRSQLSVTLRQPGASSLENLLQEKHPQERLNTSLPDIGVASSCMYLRTPPCTPAACIESPLSRPETPAPAMIQSSLKSPTSQHKSVTQGALVNASGRPHTPFPASTVPLPKKTDYHAMGMHAQTHPSTTPPNIFFSKIRHSLAPQHKLPQQALAVNNIMNDSTESGGETGYFSLFSPTETPTNNPFSNVFATSPPDHSLNPFSSPLASHVAYPADSNAYMLIPQQGGSDVPYYVRSASPYQPPVPGFIPYEATPTLLPLSQLQPVEQVFQQYFPGAPAVPAATLLTPPTMVPSPKVPASPIPQSRNPTSNESADDEAESPAIKVKAQPSPKLSRKSTKKLQHQVSTRTSSGDEGTGSSSNMIQRKPRKVSSSSHDEPNATSSPSSKHRNTIRKISSNEGGGSGSVLTEPAVASSDLSHSSTSGQESPSKQRRRVSIYFNNNNNNKVPSKRRDTVSISSIPSRGILTRSNSPELSRHERERSHSVSSSVRTNGSATSGRLRRHSGGGSTTDVGKVPWCGCWGNGCI